MKKDATLWSQWPLHLLHRHSLNLEPLPPILWSRCPDPTRRGRVPMRSRCWTESLLSSLGEAHVLSLLLKTRTFRGFSNSWIQRLVLIKFIVYRIDVSFFLFIVWASKSSQSCQTSGWPLRRSSGSNEDWFALCQESVSNNWCLEWKK